ncbi:glycosyltransferase family 4 protein [Ruegeria sp. HKCCD7318]|uniref:glycosyltransferase family 4 protein n=1 Tax=Ruegeria sp. HKCCD7318 TaxID=2683014 RepID=UPI0014921D7C|nr:glycosyltransferase family 4 protein [Ruegeria sp. HKCCD7318]NOE35826.1 glycosyltransferase [Ruegeria sp. HKCCD7318]
MKVVLLSYSFDRTDVGEALIAYKWAEALSEHVDLTVLALERRHRESLQTQLPNATVVTWPEPQVVQSAERFNAMLKPAYPILYYKVRRWLKEQAKLGNKFDLAHQIMPQAARYPCPFYGHGIPYIIGPLGGSLPTPKGFLHEMETSRWYTRLRRLDKWRFSYDPWLRRSYSNAELILGVAPYVKNTLSAIPIKKFDAELELGVDDIPEKKIKRNEESFQLLHVGRGVRTKGLREIIRALPKLKDIPNLKLISAGAGDEINICREEATKLGVEEYVTFLGKIPKSDVEKLYQEADIFVFPSFREPAGGVLYEAMRWGLPVITADYGGPAYIVSSQCGIKIPPTTSEVLSDGIASAVRELYANPRRRHEMGKASHKYLREWGLWSKKAARMVENYRDISTVTQRTDFPTKTG